MMEEQVIVAQQLVKHPKLFERFKNMLAIVDNVEEGIISADAAEQQIIDEINALGFRTHVMHFRDPHDRTKIIREKGNNQLTLKGFWKYIKNPLYAGKTLKQKLRVYNSVNPEYYNEISALMAQIAK